ncbi:MAG: ABC transporter ATP-binding protein [Dehalococcoidales bacterium]|nr:ABC transporter ATP-binding protein [Dehalococcoidales bacterium]
MNKMILQVANLSKHFGGVVAVDNLSFSVNKDEILGLIGPNGAGKSTVLNMINGAFRPTKGKIFFEGKDITGFPDHKVAKNGIGCNFQMSSLFMELPVIENIFIGFHMRYKTNLFERFLRFSSAVKEETAFRQEAEKMLVQLGMNSFRYELAKNLPYGYQRTLGVGLALITNPRLLLLDEPATGMNQNEINQMVELIKQIRQRGITIVVIEHNMEAVMKLCDRIVVLNFGQKIAEGTPKEIQGNESVIEAYLGKEID